jgi:hypothetical protein
MNELGITRTEFVRSRLLPDAKSILINARVLIGGLDAAGSYMGQAGNDIHQLARYVNDLKKKGDLLPPIAERFNALLENYLLAQRSLEAALRKIIRLMSN